MKYKVWDAVSYGEGEPLNPFTNVYESDQLNKVIEFVDENEEKRGKLFVTGLDNQMLFDSTMKIYESPDGKMVFERNMLSNKRVLINN
jgi:hypothetical protein